MALVVLPVVLLYGFGLLVATPEARSGVDVLSDVLLDLAGTSGYAYVQGGIALLIVVVAGARLGRATLGQSLLAAPVAAESLLYALVMGTAIIALMDQQHLLGPLLVPAHLVDRAVVSAGAGLHEEIAFRLLLLPALAAVLYHGLAMPRPLALAVALVASSVAFAAAHNLAGEPYEAFAFTYRVCAGGIFGLLFLARGFAVAVWTHALYDFYAMTLTG